MMENVPLDKGERWWVYRWRAEAFVRQGEYQKAVDDLDELLLEFPTDQAVIDRRNEIAEITQIPESVISGMLEFEL